MLSDQRYVVLSLELHLFFARIMKEHALFLEAGFTPKNANLAREADRYKTNFERLLSRAVDLSSGVIRPMVLSSGEIVTDFTLGSEQKTQNFTGIPINQSITVREAQLHSGTNPNITPAMVDSVRRINQGISGVLNGLINFKTQLLNDVLSCNVFTVNYPLLIEHILREARLYRDYLNDIENGQDIDNKDSRETELFWDQIMMEHALFIRGLLDPTENQLIDTSDNFANEYAVLLERARNATDQTLASVTDETLRETMRFKDFKQAGTEGIAACKIRSIILPLLADHVLREANHYIRLLRQRPMNRRR
ncbi:MAG: DUF2935 domain-containing protein [Niameybacter sp.]|nr:DUF2935 domain-containing protein [Niameybacter sp.]